VVTSDTESDRDSPPPPLKSHKGISINEPSEAPRTQQANPPTPTSGGKKLRKQIATKQVSIHSKLVSPPQDPTSASRVVSIIAPRA